MAELWAVISAALWGSDMASAMQSLTDAARSASDRLSTIGASTFAQEQRGVMNEVRMIGGALVAVVIVALVLTEVYNAVNIPQESPFYGIVEAAESTGVAAITLLVVGLLVLSAGVIMRFMGSGFGR